MSFISRSQKGTNGTYTFSSRPRPVENRSKYREKQTEKAEKAHSTYGNIMYDRRVIRGNTYAQRFLSTMVQEDLAEMQRQQELRRRAIAHKNKTKEQLRSSTPEAVQGRKHNVVQTELYLEELSYNIELSHIECQTDPLLDRPATPLFIPAKSGKDVATQIEEGELFDFDREVQPLLEVLIGKTIEQSLLEVMEEEELACLRAQQRAFQELRNAELAEVQRLQEQERRRREEKERRIAQQREALSMEKETVEKIAARAYTQQYLADLVPTVFQSLRIHGFFYDPVEKDIETNFFPWLMAEVNSKLEKRNAARQLLDALIHDVAQKKLPLYTNLETRPEK
ncbi:radial spoke head protein 3 homolog isoform X2 [Hippocampus zosterae]|uniref:radial spoke head protein 3 homolog isoform X2 n=1 Tax=Hippocampus zosterae TaxID=109293 RepID=UPI00223E07C3|nr:radial spoke head protein 3 homolog isoform X2 [Hippocampus zosterae]